jgi:hypothetical protein
VAPSDDHAIAAIAASDILRSEAAMKLPELRQAALRPATHTEIRSIIQMRDQTFGDLRTPRSEAEWTLFYADHFEALKGLTAAQIEGGMKAYVALPDSEFSPRPGRLADLARNAPAGRWMRAHRRARAAVERAQGATQPRLDEPRPSREEVQALMAPVIDSLAKMDVFAQSRAKAARPTQGAQH